MKLKFLVALGVAATLYSCDDETTGIGQFVADNDLIPAKADSYIVETESHLLNAVYSRSNTAYLGKFTDKDYGTFSSDFLVQINCPENFSLPDRIEAITDAKLGLYYDSYFGDSLATLRVQIDPLTQAIKDDGTDKNLYYSNLDPTQYYNPNITPLATKDYSAYDRTVPDSVRNSSGYYANVSLGLGEDFCKSFLEKYEYTEEVNGKTIHPYFKDSEAFINNVLKGFYVHTIGGEGSILYISDIYLHLTVAYWKTIQDWQTEEDKDTLVHVVVPMSATKEVFMSTRFQNSGLEELEKDPTRTYLKSPAGLCTEVTLPLEEIYEAHKNDTLNSISVSFQKMKEQSDSPYKMGTPQTLLMVRKDEMKSFFENNKIHDNKTSFLASYDSTNKTYAFSKLNRLISYIFSEIRPEIEKGIDSEEWKKWKTEHPNWNKLLLVPVTTESDSQGNIIGVGNDLNVNSATLVGGKNLDESQKIKMSIIYTQPIQK